jgi:protein-tyrosine phosphatase
MAATHDDSLRIDAVEVPRVPGRLGLCACPGWRHRAHTDHPTPQQRLHRDVQTMRDFGAAGLVSLMEEREMAQLGIASLPQHLDGVGLWWKHLPITDMGVPDQSFEARWAQEGASIRDALRRGEHVVMHCWAGLGRTGTMAARLLVEFGLEPEAAILRVRHARPGAIQTRHQERYVFKAARGGR